MSISLQPDPRERRPGLSLSSLLVFLCTHTRATGPATFPGGTHTQLPLPLAPGWNAPLPRLPRLSCTLPASPGMSALLFPP